MSEDKNEQPAKEQKPAVTTPKKPALKPGLDPRFAKKGPSYSPNKMGNPGMKGGGHKGGGMKKGK